MQQCNDSEVHALLRKVHPNVKVKEDRDDYDLYQKNKVRLIDPPLLREGEVIPASVVSENIRQMSDIAYEKAVRGMYVKVISELKEVAHRFRALLLLLMIKPIPNLNISKSRITYVREFCNFNNSFDGPVITIPYTFTPLSFTY